ncbi:hypothetical protein P175DRAFT_0558981 [Aspergillus ochraceoroseus IBT 24754]|nr:uncharacterized protein P175DRAFT_0558981 [Aspergillus ochraceoroseus IBT 24754]PTU19418.1 hypothetical protein P175DRAFT_0558981 [Aspergillus ochraceoroseus IBT 24754]
MAKSNILFLTNSELGQATVCLAVAHEFLLRPSYSVHIASFSPLQPAVSRLNVRTLTLASSAASTATFHTIPGRSMINVLIGSGAYQNSFSTHQIGFHGALKTYSTLPRYLAPWTGAEYMAIYKSCVDIIQELHPVMVVVDPLFAQALDACRTLKCAYVQLGPNTLKDHVIQPMLGNLWKLPILCSGYPYPLPWRLILPNAYLAVKLGQALSRSPILKELNDTRHSHGLKGAYPTLMGTSEDNTTPRLIPSRPEIDFPSFVPKNFTLCGPILLPHRHIGRENPGLAQWLSQRPTVLINMGSIVSFSVDQTQEVAAGLRILLDAKPDLQVLWKLKRDNTDKVGDFLDSIFDEIREPMINGRVRIEEWLSVEPSCILQSGYVSCMVHHGGANSYHEAVRAGVPQIVLPVWFDTYDFAARVEWLGIGVWGSKKSAPVVNGAELGQALTHVLASESSLAIQEKAKSIALALGETEGRVVACEKILELIEG